jgi:hypothetical protein
LREDHLAALEALRNLFPGLHRARLRLLPFTAEQTRKVVECPGSDLLAPGAADAILGTFLPSAADPTDTAVDAALLSLFCWQFNEQRLAADLQHLEADRIVGSRERILRDFYSSAFAGVENSKAVQRWVEESLVDAGGYSASRSWNDALAASGVTAFALNQLITRRLLHPFYRPGAPPQLELTHDRLCAVVGRCGRPAVLPRPRLLPKPNLRSRGELSSSPGTTREPQKRQSSALSQRRRRRTS